MLCLSRGLEDLEKRLRQRKTVTVKTIGKLGTKEEPPVRNAEIYEENWGAQKVFNENLTYE